MPQHIMLGDLQTTSDYDFRARISNDPREGLVFLFHGRGGGATSMLPFIRALPPAWSVIAPEGRFPDEEIGGRDWWRYGKTSFEEKVAIARDVLAFCVRAQAHCGLRPARVAAIGFSMGAYLLSLCGALEECHFSSVGFLAGGQTRGAQGERLALRRDIAFFMAHGSLDRIVPVEEARAWAAELEKGGYRLTYVEDPVGHKIGSSGLHALKEWLVTPHG